MIKTGFLAKTHYVNNYQTNKDSSEYSQTSALGNIFYKLPYLTIPMVIWIPQTYRMGNGVLMPSYMGDLEAVSENVRGIVNQ